MTRATRAGTSPVPSSRNTEVIPSQLKKNLPWEKNFGARPTRTSVRFKSNDAPADALGRWEAQRGADAVFPCPRGRGSVALDSWVDPGYLGDYRGEAGAVGLGSASFKSAAVNIFILINLNRESVGFDKEFRITCLDILPQSGLKVISTLARIEWRLGCPGKILILASSPRFDRLSEFPV